MSGNKKIAIFQKKEIRKTIHNDEWWFVIEDVVLVLTDSKDPKQYIQRLKQRDSELKKGWVQIVRTLLIETSGGKQKMICANTEGIFRIIQSIPSPKAEPFKRWMAKVGYERVQEIEDLELARSVDIALTISPTVSVESFRQYFSSINKHQKNIFENQELDENVASSILEHTTQHGAIKEKTQINKTKFHNLDATITVGYSADWIEKRIQNLHLSGGDSSIEEKQYPVGRELSSGFHPETIGGLI